MVKAIRMVVIRSESSLDCGPKYAFKKGMAWVGRHGQVYLPITNPENVVPPKHRMIPCYRVSDRKVVYLDGNQPGEAGQAMVRMMVEEGEEEERVLRESIHDGDVEDCPKCRPAPSEDAHISEETNRMNKKALKIARGMDEGETWAKVLRQVVFCAFLPPLVPRVDFGDIDKRLDQLDAETQRHLKDAALRFRAECVAPYERLLKAARQTASNLDGVDELQNAVAALSDQGGASVVDEEGILVETESIEEIKARERADGPAVWDGSLQDEPAEVERRVSDNELGHCAIRQVRDHLGGDIVGFSYLTDKDREEIGAAIRAKQGNKAPIDDEELGRFVLDILRGVHHTLGAEYYGAPTYRGVGAAIRAKLEDKG